MPHKGTVSELLATLATIKALFNDHTSELASLATGMAFSVKRGDRTAAQTAAANLSNVGPTTEAAIADRVLTVGKAILVAVIMLIVLGELYATDIVSNPDNPNAFTNMTSTFSQYGTTAFTMIGLGLIAAGAAAALAYFGMFGNTTR